MRNDQSTLGSFELRQIDVNDPDEVRRWSGSFRATQDGIKHAVAQVGASADAVRKYLMAVRMLPSIDAAFLQSGVRRSRS